MTIFVNTEITLTLVYRITPLYLRDLIAVRPPKKHAERLKSFQSPRIPTQILECLVEQDFSCSVNA